MALRAVHPLGDGHEDERREETTPAIRSCPVCEGEMELVYSRNAQQVVVCTDCHSGLTVPAGAWNIARIKREASRKSSI